MSQENVEVVRQGFERTARGDWAIADGFDPRVEFVLMGGKALGLAEHGRGVDELMGVLREFMSEFEGSESRPSSSSLSTTTVSSCSPGIAVWGAPAASLSSTRTARCSRCATVSS